MNFKDTLILFIFTLLIFLALALSIRKFIAYSFKSSPDFKKINASDVRQDQNDFVKDIKLKQQRILEENKRKLRENKDNTKNFR